MTHSCSARGSEQSLLFHFPCIAYDFTDLYHYCLFSGLKSHNHSAVTQQELSIHFIIHPPTWCSCVADKVISQIRFKLYGQISSPDRIFLQNSCQIWFFCGNYKIDDILNKHLSTGLHALSSAGTRSRNTQIFQTNPGRRRGKWDLATILRIKKIIELFFF